MPLEIDIINIIFSGEGGMVPALSRKKRVKNAKS